MASRDRDAARYHGAGPAVARQPASGTLGTPSLPLSRSAQPCAGRAVEAASCARCGRAGAARHPDHDQWHFRRLAEYGLVRHCEERSDDVSAVAQRAKAEAIQTSFRALDCFAEPVIGPRFARTRWLAMTTHSPPYGFSAPCAPV